MGVRGTLVSTPKNTIYKTESNPNKWDESDESKRTIYRAIADKHGYTMERIEYIDSHKNNIS